MTLRKCGLHLGWVIHLGPLIPSYRFSGLELTLNIPFLIQFQLTASPPTYLLAANAHTRNLRLPRIVPFLDAQTNTSLPSAFYTESWGLMQVRALQAFYFDPLRMVTD